ncbi:hypothetical protein ACFLR3_04165 [Campylobacterota bacterium]
MIKWLVLLLVVAGIALYFVGALEVDNTQDSVSVTVDKSKAKELGESIKDKIEE